jgi:hypothetical protein
VENVPQSNKLSLQALHFQLLDGIRELEIVTLDLNECSDLYVSPTYNGCSGKNDVHMKGEHGDDMFQRAHVVSPLTRDPGILNNLQKLHSTYESALYQAAVRLIRHSDFPVRETIIVV